MRLWEPDPPVLEMRRVVGESACSITPSNLPVVNDNFQETTSLPLPILPIFGLG